MKNKWFKHYNTAHEGQTISELWAENDHETIAFYWTLLELVSRFEDPEKRGFWSANLSIFRSKLGMKSQRSRKLLSKIAQRFRIELTWKSDQSFELLVPNFLELQETRGGKRRAKKEQNTERSKKREERSKKREEREQKPTNPPTVFCELVYEFQQRKKLSFHSLPLPTGLKPTEVKACVDALARAPIEKWREALLRAEQSSYLRGETEERFQITFRWLLSRENPDRILAGTYDDFNAKRAPPPKAHEHFDFGFGDCGT